MREWNMPLRTKIKNNLICLIVQVLGKDKFLREGSAIKGPEALI
jgi:hypothetical protein